MFTAIFLLLACAPQLVESDTGFAESPLAQALAAEPRAPLAARTFSTGRDIRARFHMPVHSGEWYQATDHSGGLAGSWDLNMSGTSGAADLGEPIVAVADGWVMTDLLDGCQHRSSCPAYGNHVKIDHDGDDVRSYYAHLDRVAVEVGQWVERGQTIGFLGGTGRSTAPHLHFEIRELTGHDADGTEVEEIVNPRFHYYKEAAEKKVAAYFSDYHNYLSYNHGEITSARDDAGRARVGNPTSVTAERVHEDGFAKSFDGGSWGPTTIYYHASGCDDGAGCSPFDNTNDAWIVSGTVRDTYYDCGGPEYCDLGFPTGAERSWGAGRRQTFERGALYHESGDTDAVFSYY